MLEIISTPTKQKGVKTSRWVACHNPVVFKAQTDAIPNTRDSAVAFASVREFRGLAIFTLSSVTNPEWFAPFLKITISGSVYNTIATVTRFDAFTLDVYTDVPYQSDDSGAVNKYYDGYLLEVLPTIGLPSGHIWESLKPESDGNIQQIEPNNSISVFDLQKQLQRNVNNQNNLQQLSFPNDLNAFTGFTIAYRESYIDLIGEESEEAPISSYDASTSFVSITVSSISGFTSGGYAVLQGFDSNAYNGSVVRIVQLVNSTTLELEISYDAYLSLTGYETIQPFNVTLSRFNGDYTEEGNQYWAVNAKQALGSFFGSNLIDYVASSPSELATFMTIFERRQVFADKFEDFTVIVDSNLLNGISGDVVMAYRQEELDENGVVIDTNIEIISSQGEGVYRLPTGGNPTESILNLTANVDVSGVQLNWDSFENIPMFANYEIWRSEVEDVFENGTLLATSLVNSYLDDNTIVNGGIKYYYRVRAVGSYASKFSNEVNATYLLVLFQTDRDFGTDGNLVADIVTSDGSLSTWTLPDLTQITTNNLNTALGGFDGTIKDVILTIEDFSKITNFDITGKIVGEIDISLLTKVERVDLRSNPSMTQVHTASDNLGANDGIRINSSNISGIQSFINTLFTNTALLNISSNPNATGVQFSNALGLNSIGQLNISNCNFSGIIDATNASITDFTATSGNTGLTGINPYIGGSVDGGAFIALGCNFSGTLNLSTWAVSALTIQNQSLTTVLLSTLSKRMTNISLNGQNIRTIDFGSATFSGTGNLIQLQDLNGDGLMTSAQISQICIDVNNRAIAGSGIMRFDGNNLALNASGIVAKDALGLKGYTVLFN